MSVMANPALLVDTVSKKYMHTSRFLPAICSEHRSEDLQFKMNIALNAEMAMLYERRQKFPWVPEKRREYREYDICTQMSFMLCMRLTNLCKCISILRNYDEGDSLCMIQKLDYIKSVLQGEYNKLHGQGHSELVGGKATYRTVHGLPMTFAEYLAYTDLFTYFHKQKAASRAFFLGNKKQMFHYVCTAYLEIELEFIRFDIEDALSGYRNELDFVNYYRKVKDAKKEIEWIQAFIEMYKMKLDGSGIYDSVCIRKIIVMPQVADEA